MDLGSLKNLYIEELRSLYDAENQLLDALPRVADACSSPRLREAFESHVQETQEQVSRLEQIFESLGESPEGEGCEAMAGLIRDVEDLLDRPAEPPVRDAGLIAAAQKVEHFEIAGYGCVRTYAKLLNLNDEVVMLEKSLEEEHNADATLNYLAENLINIDASRA